MNLTGLSGLSGLISAGSFTPADLTGLALWLNAEMGLFQERSGASASTPASSDGDPVGSWLDQSGNGRHAIALSDAKRPTLKLGVQNGRNVVRGDGTDDVLRSDVVASAVLTGSDVPFSLVWAGKQSSTSGNRSFWGSARSGSGHPLHRFRCNATSSYHSDRRDDSGTSVSVSGGTPDTSAHVFALVFTGTTVSLWRDGTAVFTGQAQNVGTLTLDAFSVLGWSRPSPEVDEEFLAGDLFELLLYDSALSDAPRQELQAYLKTRWGTP